MRTSQNWIDHFRSNLQVQRVDWSLAPAITSEEKKEIIDSLKAWQLGETSDGAHLLAASRKYAWRIDDADYPKAVELFIREEQKHGNNLGRYIDSIGESRVQKDWGDTLFRKIRYMNSSMELWTIAVITVESTAQIFYQSLKDATECTLLKQISTDILIDEAAHIEFQMERLAIIYSTKDPISKFFAYHFYKYFYYTVILVVWFAHRRAFKAGKNTFWKYFRKMNLKFRRTIGELKYEENHVMEPADYTAY
ncbi:MAG TPA: ferritin-like domain-containing protein [Bacteroidia bacterium]|nr:ferritin-like domain-containing protein [Bacteroidia bacterium]